MTRLGALLLLCCGQALACEGISFENVWIREPPPGHGPVAAYLTIKNVGTERAVLKDWRSEAFAHVMLHATKRVDDRVQMLHQAELAVPAGASVVLAPGGMHLMLMKAGVPVVAGKHYRLSVSCNGASATFDATVRREEASRP